MWQNDPLFVVHSKRDCKVCGGGRRQRKKCEACQGGGFERIDLAGLWAPQPGFLVCGGPSLNNYPVEAFRQRGIVSLGINNAAAYLPCKAMTFDDPQTKFHSGIYFDACCMVFSPVAKLRRCLRVKLPDGTFHGTNIQLRECPSMFGVSRSGQFSGKDFFTTSYCHWGHGGHGPDKDQRPFTRLATMLMGVRLLHYLGCPRIYLLGVDFGGKEYAWHQSTSCGNIWHKINTLLTEIVEPAREQKFEIFNCNSESNCSAFPHVPFDEAYNDCCGGVPMEPWDCHDWYGKKLHKEMEKRFPERWTWDQVVAANRDHEAAVLAAK